MTRPLVPVVAALAIAAATALPGAAAPTSSPAVVDPTYALVQLSGLPISTSADTRPQNGRKISLTGEAVRNRRAVLAAERNAFRQWLRTNAPAARVTGEFDLALNAVGVNLNGTPVETLRAAPGVRFVEEQGVFRAADHQDPDLSLSHVAQAWSAVGGAPSAGRGVGVAIIDSGIDVTHPCFDDAGYPDVPEVGDPALTNDKVTVARVYGNKVAKDGFDASDQNGHGTHVAGTVACNPHTPATVAGVDIPYDPSGIAPAARLGSYNVFPGSTGSARSEDILQALEDAYEDGFDVANMSLGGARNDGGGAFLLDNAIDNLDRANMVVAVAAGNEGPGYFTVHYPGAAERALTAGASTVGHNVVNTVTVAGASYDAVVGEFAPVASDVSGPLGVVRGGTTQPHGLSTACDTDPALPPLTGTIALLGRGACDFTVKVRNAQRAGAIGVIVVTNAAGAPSAMGHNGLEDRPTIPAVMVSLATGAVIDDQDGATATLNALGVYKTFPETTHVMAGFSSQGPTHGDLLIKPDVVAPGADVLSAQPASTCAAPPCWAFLGGTSMATPHLAGAAAVVRAAHPGWSAEQVRSAVVNTAQQGVLRHPQTGAQTDDPLIVGAGLMDVQDAVAASAGLSPVSRSFGAWSSGAGGTRTATVTVTNLSGSARTYAAAVDDRLADGITFSTPRSSFTLAPGASSTVTVTAAASGKRVADGHKWATLRVSSGGTEVAHAMLYTLVGEGDAAPGRHMSPPPFA
jgi:minor extracellular serine protease Vpr